MRSLLFLLLALPQSDAAAVRKVMEQYVAAWLAGDSAAVMRRLTPDSVLVPGDKKPYVGAEALRNYWWPPNAPKFTLDRFDSTIDEISGGGDWAFVRGTQVIEWTSGEERWRTRGNYMTVLKRTEEGWKIATQMAASGGNERVK